tara:strand:- start:1054 stop:1350 length:297 start_codon:yes stop_codon:yes gene_type:complete
MKFYHPKYFFKSITFIISLLLLISSKSDLLKAEDLYFEEIQIESSTKSDTNNSEIPTNPFEIVEMIRQNNSLNDATIPSDAIENALKSFDNIVEKEDI